KPKGALAVAVIAGEPIASVLGEGKRADLERDLEKELGRKPTKEEIDSAVTDYGAKEISKTSLKIAKDSADQAALAIKVKGDPILKDEKAAKAKYDTEAARLEAESKKTKKEDLAAKYSELATLSDFGFMKDSVSDANALADKGAEEIKRSIDLVKESEDAEEAPIPLVSKRIVELSSGLGSADKVDLDKALAGADALEKAGKKKEADGLRRGIYKALLSLEAKRLMEDGKRLLAVSNGATDALVGLNTSTTKVDTLNRELGRSEFAVAAKTS